MTDQDLIGKSYMELQAMFVAPSEPARISMTPATEGWLWVGAALAVLAVICLNKWIAYREANAYRRAGVSALKVAGDDAGAIALVLRRVALVAYPRDAVAALHGDDWLRFLDSSWTKSGFETDMGRKMLAAPYHATPVSVTGLNRLATDWVRHHNAEAAS